MTRRIPPRWSATWPHMSARRGGGSGNEWTEAQLFADGELGCYFSTAESSMWQNSGRTVAASIGTAVGAVDDLSGNGNHLLQSTTSKRLSLASDGGGRVYLVTDLTDDFFGALGIFGGSDATTFTIWVAGIHGPNSSSNIRPVGLGSLSEGAGDPSASHFNQARDASLRYDGSFTAGTQTFVSGASYVRISQRSGGAVGDWVDDTVNIDPTTTASLPATVDDFYLPPITVSGPAPGYYYAMGAVNRVLTSDERDKLTTRLASYQGRTI